MSQRANTLTASGAERIARMIKSYWADRGQMVETSVEPFVAAKTGGPAIHCIRSNMIGGLPRGTP